VDTLYFPAASRPQLVNFDADKILLAEKKENKTLEEYLFQYQQGRNFLDRYEALAAATQKQADKKALDIIMLALNDKYQGLRNMGLQSLDLTKGNIKNVVEEKIYALAQNDPKKRVRAAAIARLDEYNNTKYLPLFRAAVNDSSYSVSGRALEAIGSLDTALARTEALRLSKSPMKGKLASAVTKVMIQSGDEGSAEMAIANFEAMPLTQEKFETIAPLAEYLTKIKVQDLFRRGVNGMVKVVTDVPEAYRKEVQGYVEMMLRRVQQAKTASGEKELADFVNTRITEMNKKGF
jgi:aminopeptidase N